MTNGDHGHGRKRRSEWLKERGVFSIENVWFEKIDGDGVVVPDVTSIEPILEALSKHYGTPFVHRDVATKKELKFFIKRWCKYPWSYPILHIGIHGSAGQVCLADGPVDIREIGGWINVPCDNCIIHFSSCGVLRGADLTSFLDGEGSFSAVSGYSKKMYPMFDAWPFEMIYFAHLNRSRHKRLEPDAMRRVNEKLSEEPYAKLKQHLGFKVHVAR